jgi:hypothetical protein
LAKKTERLAQIMFAIIIYAIIYSWDLPVFITHFIAIKSDFFKPKLLVCFSSKELTSLDNSVNKPFCLFQRSVWN